jgi:hypothetical protein
VLIELAFVDAIDEEKMISIVRLKLFRKGRTDETSGAGDQGLSSHFSAES